MARKKVKAVPILMAFMAMVCSIDCEVSNLRPKLGQIGQLATVLTVMARKKVKAILILMAFMAIVCSNNCEVSYSGPKIGQKQAKNWPKISQLASALTRKKVKAVSILMAYGM